MNPCPVDLELGYFTCFNQGAEVAVFQFQGMVLRGIARFYQPFATGRAYSRWILIFQPES